jgi:N-acetylglucosaminyldiphosphoundecaprenol N-acetyl-beta-D-mannosaminyltransferase
MLIKNRNHTNQMQKHTLLSIDLSLGSYSDFVDEIIRLANMDDSSEYICVANVHMLVEAYKDKEFAKIVNNAVITTPDGVPLTWGLKWLYGIKQERVAGMDLFPDLLRVASQQAIPVFFYGGTETVLSGISEYIKTHYSEKIFAGSYSPPFCPLTPDEEEKIINRINASGAKLVFVSLGCPKQEKWMASMKGRIKATMIGVGGAFSTLSGMKKMAPPWMRKSGLEWSYRLFQEPKRLFKRYFTTNTIFLYLLIKAKIKRLRFSHK